MFLPPFLIIAFGFYKPVFTIIFDLYYLSEKSSNWFSLHIVLSVRPILDIIFCFSGNGCLNIDSGSISIFFKKLASSILLGCKYR